MNIRPDILTKSGVYFNFLHPDRSAINIEDIAHGLSHVCRFAGQCNQFYSVAEHSWHVSKMMPTKELALVGLLHDAAEAYVGDVTAPLKQLLINYKLIEERVHNAIFYQLGIDPVMPPIIKEVDLRMLATEQKTLMPPHDDEWQLIAGVAPYDFAVNCWSPMKSKVMFLERFEELTNVVA